MLPERDRAGADDQPRQREDHAVVVPGPVQLVDQVERGVDADFGRERQCRGGLAAAQHPLADRPAPAGVGESVRRRRRRGAHVGLADPAAHRDRRQVDAQLPSQRAGGGGGADLSGRGRRLARGDQPAHHGAHRHHLAGRHHLPEHARGRRLHREADLVGLQVVQRLPGLHRCAVLLQPGGQPALGHDVAELRETQVGRHDASPAAWPARRRPRTPRSARTPRPGPRCRAPARAGP